MSVAKKNKTTKNTEISKGKRYSVILRTRKIKNNKIE